MLLRRTPLPVLIIGAVALLLGAIIAGFPWWLGLQAEQRYRQRLEQFTATTGFPATVTRYARGWRSSEASTEIRLSPQVPPLVLTHRLEHGPLLLDESAAQSLVARLALLRLRGELYSAPAAAPVQLEAITDFTARWQLTVHGPGGQLAVGAQRFEWETLQGVFAGSADGDLHTQFDLLKAGWDTAARSWRADKLRLTGEWREGEAGFPFGQIVLTAARLAYTDGWLDDLRAEITAHAESRGATLGLAGTLRSWHHAGESFGPGTLALSARHLEPEITLALARLTPSLLRPEQAGGALAALAPLAGLLGRRSPAAELHTLQLTAAKSELRGHGRLLLDGQRLGGNARGAAVLTALRGELDILVPTPLAQLIPEAHWLTPEEDHFRLRATLARGRLLVNDEPWHGPLFLAP